MFKVEMRLLCAAALLGCLVATQSARAVGQTPDEIEQMFETRYRAWIESGRRNLSPSSEFDVDAAFDNNPAFQELVKLGIPAVPYMFERLKENRYLGGALHEITGWSFDWVRVGDTPREWTWSVEEFPDMVSQSGPPDTVATWLRWWHGGRNQTPQWFAQRYGEWKALKAAGKDKEAAEKYQRIKDLGIAALPCMIERVELGDTDVMPAMSALTDGELPAKANAATCLAWWAANKHKWTLPPVEVAEPVAEPESGSPPGESRAGDSGAE